MISERGDAEVAAGLALLICAGVLLVAAFAAPSLGGEWFPARHLVAAFPVAAALAAWGLRHAPRTGAVLGALTLLVLGVARARAGVRGRRRMGATRAWTRPLGPAVRAAAAVRDPWLAEVNCGWAGGVQGGCGPPWVIVRPRTGGQRHRARTDVGPTPTSRR